MSLTSESQQFMIFNYILFYDRKKKSLLFIIIYLINI